MERPSTVKDREALLEIENEDDQPGRDVIIMFAVFFEGGLAPLSLFLGWWLGHNPLAQFAWSETDALWGVLAAVPLVLLFLLTLRWPVGPLRQIKTFCEEEFIPLLAGSTWSDMALIALSAGVGEEMLFRGVLQSFAGSLAGDRLGPLGRQSALRPAASDFDALHRRYRGRGVLFGRGLCAYRESANGDGDSFSLRFCADVLPLAISLPRWTDQPDPSPRS